MSKNINITQLLDEKQKNDLLSLYQNNWWSYNRTKQDVDFILKNSSFYVGIVDVNDNRLIAFSRILTDYFQFSYIYDVIVHKDYRNLGLGKQLIQTIINHPALKDVKNIELVCRKDMMQFYKNLGFSEDYGKSISMRLQRINSSESVDARMGVTKIGVNHE